MTRLQHTSSIVCLLYKIGDLLKARSHVFDHSYLTVIMPQRGNVPFLGNIPTYQSFNCIVIGPLVHASVDVALTRIAEQLYEGRQANRPCSFKNFTSLPWKVFDDECREYASIFISAPLPSSYTGARRRYVTISVNLTGKGLF